MALVVEDGTGLSDANSYVTVDQVYEYALARGLTFPPSPGAGNEPAIIRATAAIDLKYGASFTGDLVNGRAQGLQWPRSGAYDASGWSIPEDEVPKEIVKAVCEAAVRELESPGSMMPDLERGGAIRSLSAGSVSITYADDATPKTVYTMIDSIMANITNGVGSSGGGLFGNVVRG